MHEIGPCPHYQLLRMLALDFCIFLVSHCAGLLRPVPLGRVQLRQHLRVWRPLQISLLSWGKIYSSIPRKERLKTRVDTDGLYCPLFARPDSWVL